MCFFIYDITFFHSVQGANLSGERNINININSLLPEDECIISNLAQIDMALVSCQRYRITGDTLYLFR